MKNFSIGLALGLIGAILWVVVCIAAFVTIDFGTYHILRANLVKYAGFAAMVGGPLTYWIILPIKEWRDRRN